MKELYLFLTTVLLDYNKNLFIDLYKSNYEQDVLTEPAVLIEMTNVSFKPYQKDVLRGEVTGRLHYIQSEYTDSNNASATREYSLQILENVQKLISKIHLAKNGYFSQVLVTGLAQNPEVSNQNIFVIDFSTSFLLKRNTE
jgi:phage tail sheath gpL-like